MKKSTKQLIEEKRNLEHKIEYLKKAENSLTENILESQKQMYESVKINNIDKELEQLRKELKSLRWKRNDRKLILEAQIQNLEEGRKLLQRVINEQLVSAKQKFYMELHELEKKLQEIESTLS